MVALAPVVTLAFFVVQSSAISLAKPHLRGGGGNVRPMVMHMFAQDCTRRKTSTNVTGDIAVLKDGYYLVDCVKDYMFEHADRFGNNKASYKPEQVANVSIVHYSSQVAREDRESMSHQVCFRFCRTIPDMGFFGLTNGRDCYCTPYYKASAGDSSMCDAPCDGDSTTMCGGKSKSSVFGMHYCGNTAEEAEEAYNQLSELSQDLSESVETVGATFQEMQDRAAAFQDKFGKVGDAAASDLLQSAKVYAGELEKAHAEGTKLVDSVDSMKSELSAATGSSVEAQNIAEDLRTKFDSTTIETEDLLAKMKKHVEASTGSKFEGNVINASNASNENNASAQYYHAMYFVNKVNASLPSTCSGTKAEEPIVATKDVCARACDGDVHECVGFSFFPFEANDKGLCFLMSKLKTLTFYTKCAESDVQYGTSCFVKFSKFNGATLKPDPSGKCEMCLKEAKQADRCFN